MLQLLQTWETKFFIKQSFSGNRKLFTSKEVEEFLKMCQKSNSRSVRDKNHRKSMLECTGNTLASWPLNQQRYHLVSQKQESSTAYSAHISKVQVLNDQALFLCWPWMDKGGLHCVTKCIIVWWLLLLYSQFPVVKKEIQSTLSKSDTFGTGPKCPS